LAGTAFIRTLDAERVGIARVGRHLSPVMRLDAVAGEPQRRQSLGIAGGRSGVDLLALDANATQGEVAAVEAARQVDQRGIAVAAHLVDDAGDDGADVGCLLALLAEQRLERA
jgi:hypothetical protein